MCEGITVAWFLLFFLLDGCNPKPYVEKQRGNAKGIAALAPWQRTFDASQRHPLTAHPVHGACGVRRVVALLEGPGARQSAATLGLDRRRRTGVG